MCVYKLWFVFEYDLLKLLCFFILLMLVLLKSFCYSVLIIFCGLMVYVNVSVFLIDCRV